MSFTRGDPFEQYRVGNGDQSARVVLSQLRLICDGSDRKGLHVKSNIDRTEKLDGKTDESLSYTDRDLVVLQNKLERSCCIILEALRMPEGRLAVLKPSRQPHRTLCGKDVSEVRSIIELELGPGESCVIHSSEWVPQRGNGARVAV